MVHRRVDTVHQICHHLIIAWPDSQGANNKCIKDHRHVSVRNHDKYNEESDPFSQQKISTVHYETS